jgi:cellulose biosynthesis protein BcsQ
MIGKIKETISHLRKKRDNLVPDLNSRIKAAEENKERQGWISPTYSQSKRIYLDPGLISGGRPCQEIAEMLGSPRMKDLVSEMKSRYRERYIIFDVPPILSGAEALTFYPLVDSVVVVVQAGKTSMDDVKKALQFIPKEKILGFALNRCLTSSQSEPYGQ